MGSEGATQEFLDNSQYKMGGILRYEWIFGHTFISTGGLETTEEFCKLLSLKPGSRVLDVGCGIGGSAFYMAEKYGATVLAIDLSTNMIAIGRDRRSKQPTHVQDKVSFECGDILEQSYPAGSFDVIYSRDTILHIANKQKLFNLFHSWLAPGGSVLITDYCQGNKVLSPAFISYVKQREYNLTTVKQYGSLLEKAGFTDVQAIDSTDKFIQILRTEVNRFQKKKEDFLKEFSVEDYDAIANGWNDKVVRSSSGDQAWGLFLGKKPS